MRVHKNNVEEPDHVVTYVEKAGMYTIQISRLKQPFIAFIYNHVSKKCKPVDGEAQLFNSNINGAGLGLYMVKTQIMALRSKIEVQSEEGKGTTFYITFKSKKSLMVY